ncbi:MAG: DUF1501 domain-containing protein [Acidobacteria bacterium]|nr:DUF1501 domain-containing protein [Acidobacteriota bacterium]
MPIKIPSERLTASTRRRFLSVAGSGLGALAFGSLMEGSGRAAENPLAPRTPHLAPKAKSVIWLFMEGGASHVDTFDPKPALRRLDGQPVPDSFDPPKITAMGTAGNTIMTDQREWAQHGQSGLWVSNWYSHVAHHVDDLAVIRSCWADGLNHVGSVCQMNTGSILAGRPSLGAWVTYGLGAANNNLPTFVVLDTEAPLNGGAKNWSAGFLPAVYQGTRFQKDGPPILNLANPETVGDAQQRGKLDFLGRINRHHAERHPGESELDARLESYELAWRMQANAPEAVDIASESEATRRLYGLDDDFLRPCAEKLLLARRLVERGVRFVEVYAGSWDAHSNIEGNHSKWCRYTDQPIAGLLADLKSRGLLDETLVVWAGEFGRTPFNEKGDGRDHNPWGFTIWMAGGGVQGGQTIGSTDEIGLRAIDKPYHVHDIHATVLDALGLNHLSLTYLHNGRSERPTVNGGNLIEGLFA